MNPLFRLLVVGSLFTTAHTFAADAFEGKVSFKISTAGAEPRVMDYTMKGPKLRMDMTTDEPAAAAESSPRKKHGLLPGFLTKRSKAADETSPSSAAEHSDKKKTVTTIMDSEKQEMITLMPEEKMYMVMPIKHAMQKAAEHADKATDVQLTGKTETILGYKCEQIIVTDKERRNVTELWVAAKLGTFMGMGGGGGGGMFGGHKSAASAKWEEVLKGKSGFPLRVVATDSEGKETSRMEVTKIEPGSQPDSLFLPPPDYEKFSMPNMGDLNPFKQR